MALPAEEAGGAPCALWLPCTHHHAGLGAARQHTSSTVGEWVLGTSVSCVCAMTTTQPWNAGKHAGRYSCSAVGELVLGTFVWWPCLSVKQPSGAGKHAGRDAG